MSQDFESGANSSAEAGRFAVLRGLGMGAKGETYLCQDTQTGGMVVRKFLNPEVSAEHPDIVDAHFSDWGCLNHPNVAKVLDFGWEEGRAYLNSEFAEGVPILQALSGAPLDRVWRAFAQLLLALDHLYAHNVPHLDLKPKNVLVQVEASGEVRLKLVDYGLMPLLYPHSPTDSNAIGTAPYAAPEYALRRCPDLRADLYSVGVLLFSVLARRPPYEAKDPAALLQLQLQRDAPALKSVVAGAPAPLSDFLQRLLSRDPEGRFQSPQQALAALQAALGGAFPEIEAPLPFSDAQSLFREKDYLKIFRRIVLQGGRWAIQAPAGGGKSHLARWVERLLWRNQKNVLRLSGDRLSLIQGEVSLNPAFPTYLIIDDADRAPVEAWLRARPYSHVIALGWELGWATKEREWQARNLKPLDAEELAALLQKNFGEAEPRLVEVLRTRWQASPARLRLAGGAFRRQGLLRREGTAWRLDGVKLLQAAQGPQLAALGSPLASLAEAPRRALAPLALAPAPWPASELSAEGEWEAWAREGWVRRSLKGGQEFFSATFLAEGAVETGLDQASLVEALRAIGRRGWPGTALAACERLWPDAATLAPEQVLLRAELQVGAGRYADALGLLTAALVNALPAERKGPAFEALGTALSATGKDKQAEAAYKSAFPAYKGAGDGAGQARVLAAMGSLTLRGGDTGRALQFFQQGLGAAANSDQAELLRGQIELEIAQLYAGATDFESAETHFQTALASLEAARQGEALARGYAVYAEHCLQVNDPDRAEVFCHEALGWALFQGDSRTQARVFSTWGAILRQREDMRGALGRLGEAVEVLAGTPHEAAYLGALLARADFLESQRDFEAAQQDTRAAFELARRLKSQALEGATLLVVGKLQSRDLEKPDAAMKTLQNARNLLAQSGDLRRLWECDFQMGEIERFRGNSPAARAFYQRAAQGLDQILAGLAPQGFDHEQLSRRRRELDMALGVLG
ncbi:MAG: protein kinase [bacterium]